MMVSVKVEPVEVAAHLHMNNGQLQHMRPPSALQPRAPASSSSTMALTHQSQQSPITNGNSQPSPPRAVNPGTPNSGSSPPEVDPDIDIQSKNGHFGWITIDEINIPCIFRAMKEYVPVRIVEKKLLIFYPNSFPDDLGKQEPLVSFFITKAEAELLNEINRKHCHGEFGNDDFSEKDLIVGVSEFQEFYNLVKKTFPENGVKQTKTGPDEAKLRNFCGWVQINNTVSPYIKRPPKKFVPLSVIRHAAGLLKDASCEGELPSQEECAMLNNTCKCAGLDFTFTLNSKIIDLNVVLSKCRRVKVRDLPFDDPLKHGVYVDEVPPVNTSHQHVPPGLPPVLPQASLQPGQQHCMPQGPPQMVQHRQPLPPQQMPRPPMPQQQMSQLPMSQQQLQRQQQMMLQQQQQQRGPIPRPQQQPMGQPATNGVPAHAMGPCIPAFPGQHPHGGLMVPMSIANFHVTPNMGHPGPRLMQPPQQPQQQQRNQGNSMLQTMHFPPGQLMSRPNTIQAPNQRQQHPAHPTGNYVVSAAAKNLSVLSQPPSGSAVPVSQMQWVSMGMPNVPPALQPAMQGRRPQGQPMVNQGVLPIMPFPAHSNAPPQQNHRAPIPVMQSANTVSAPPRVMPPKAQCPPMQPGPNTQLRTLPRQTNPKTSRSNGPMDQDLKKKLMESIQGYIIKEKSISCMKIETEGKKGLHCLVEAVCKLYFPTSSFTEFILCMETVLNRKVFDLTPEEEAAFIAYYNLPISSLKCSKSILLTDLEKFFPQLTYALNRDKKEDSASKGQPAPQKATNGAGPVHPSSSAGLVGKDTRKRAIPSGSSNSPSPLKKPNKSVEDVIQKIKHGKGGGSTVPSSSAGHQNSKDRGVIVLD